MMIAWCVWNITHFRVVICLEYKISIDLWDLIWNISFTIYFGTKNKNWRHFLGWFSNGDYHSRDATLCQFFVTLLFSKWVRMNFAEQVWKNYLTITTVLFFVYCNVFMTVFCSWPVSVTLPFPPHHCPLSVSQHGGESTRLRANTSNLQAHGNCLHYRLVAYFGL